MLRSFFSNISVRPSCYDCKFKKRYRESDFTMWDCLEPANFDKRFDNNRGVTRVLVHTDKGIKIISELKKYGEFKIIDAEKAVENVKEMVCSVEYNSKRDSFFENLNNSAENPEKVFKEHFPITPSIKIKVFMRKIMIKLHVHGFVRRILKAIKK